MMYSDPALAESRQAFRVHERLGDLSHMDGRL